MTVVEPVDAPVSDAVTSGLAAAGHHRASPPDRSFVTLDGRPRRVHEDDMRQCHRERLPADRP